MAAVASSGGAMGFFQQLGAFSAAVEADCAEIQGAMQLPVGGAGSCGSFSSLLEDSLDRVSQTRDKTAMLLSTLTSPSLQELVDVVTAMYEENQQQLEGVEEALCIDPTYSPFSVAAAENSLAHHGGSGVGHRLSGGGRLSGGTEDSFSHHGGGGAVAQAAKVQAYDSPAPLPAHLQVEPKTPDLDDFGISSFSLNFLDKDSAAHESLAAPSAAARADPKAGPDSSESDALDMSPGLSSRYNIDTPKRAEKSAPAVPAAVEEHKEAPAPPAPSMVSSRRGGGGEDMGCVGGDTMFPLMVAVSDEQFDSVPEYLRSQISCELLNSAVNKINDYVTDKRFDPDNGSDHLTTEELQNKLRLGIKTKAYVLLLMHLGRIKTSKVKGQIVYKIVA